MTRHSISIVMPCLNEEANIADSVKNTLIAFDRHGIDGEIIIIDDGSVDDTYNISKQLTQADSRVSLIRNQRNLGIGASFLVGIRAAKNDLVSMFPGDNENDAYDALRYISIMDSVDILVPFVQNVEVRSRFRRVVSSLYRLIINISFGMNLNYTNGTVIYNRKILGHLNDISSGFFYQAEILIRLIRIGYLYAETPHLLNTRNSGKTKAITLRSFLNVSISYLRLFAYVHVSRSIGRTDLPIIKETATYRRICNE